LKRDDATESPAEAGERPIKEDLAEPERRLVKIGFVSRIWGFLRRPPTTFRAIKEDTLSSALKYALICLVILGAAAGIVLALLGPDVLFELGLGELAGKLLSIPITIGLSIAGGMISLFVGGAWTHLWVKLLGGRHGCSYRQTLKALAYGATPAYLLGWVPIVIFWGTDSILATGLIGALISIWPLVLTIIGLRELHGITTGRAVVVYLLATVIAALVAVSLLVAFIIHILIYALTWPT